MDKSFFSQQKYTFAITETHKCGSDNHSVIFLSRLKEECITKAAAELQR